MASGCPEGSGSLGENWVPSPELLEERELLSGLVDGLSNLAAGAPGEEATVVPDPGAEGPPAVVVPPAEVPVRAAAAQAPAIVSTQAPAPTAQSPASVGHATAPGTEAVDTLLAKLAVAGESHADSTAGAVVQGPTASHAADAKAAEAHAVPAPAAGSVSAHDTGTAGGRVDGGASTDLDLELPPTDEESVQPPMTSETPSVEHSAGTVEQDTAVPEDHRFEEGEASTEAGAPTERSLLPSAGDHAEPNPSGVVAELETPQVRPAGEVTIVKQAGAGAEPEARADELVSRVSQLFDLVPNWPGVDHDALEGAARSVVADGAPSGSDPPDAVSTQDVTTWATALAGTAVGFGIDRRDLGLQTRDTADAPADEEVELTRSFT
jgi:hypothetical protein